MRKEIKQLKEATRSVAATLQEGDLTDAEKSFVRNVLKTNLFTAIGALEYIEHLREEG